jgi:hypothetical protein
LAAPIFTGREKSLDLAFSDLDGGLSSTEWGIGGGGSNGGGCGDDPASLGELWPDLGKTTLAAVAAAEECPPSLSIFNPLEFDCGEAESRDVLDSVKLKVGGLKGVFPPLPRLMPSVTSACKGTV